MRRFGLGMLLAALTMPVMAVDGYKNLKFGMSPKEVIKTKTCRFGALETDDNQLQRMSCMDFNFSGGKTFGQALFIDNKLVRVGIMLKDENQLTSVIKGVSKKYGEPSTPMSREDFVAVSSMPNQTADVGFDNDTVMLRLMSDANNNQTYLLMYTVNNYDQLLDEIAAKANSDDL
jgi:hypothetical protein